jgi:hypothetical protein
MQQHIGEVRAVVVRVDRIEARNEGFRQSRIAESEAVRPRLESESERLRHDMREMMSCFHALETRLNPQEIDNNVAARVQEAIKASADSAVSARLAALPPPPAVAPLAIPARDRPQPRSAFEEVFVLFHQGFLRVGPGCHPRPLPCFGFGVGQPLQGCASTSLGKFAPSRARTALPVPQEQAYHDLLEDDTLKEDELEHGLAPDKIMVPPTPLASLSSYADRFATIIFHRRGHVLTPGSTILG